MTRQQIIQEVAKAVAANYHNITGVNPNELEFQRNIDPDFDANSFELIEEWVQEEFSEYLPFSNREKEDFLVALDWELTRIVMRGWSYIS